MIELTKEEKVLIREACRNELAIYEGILERLFARNDVDVQSKNMYNAELLISKYSVILRKLR